MKSFGLLFTGFVAGFATLFILIMMFGDYDEPVNAIPPVVVAQGVTPTVPPLPSPLPTLSPTVSPTSTSLPTATLAPRRPDMGDTEKLLRVFAGHAFASGMLRDLAEQVQAEQMDDLQAAFILAATQSVLESVAPGVDFAYFAPLTAHANVAKSQQDALYSITRRWANGEITSAVVPQELDSINVLGATERLVGTLKASGIRDSELSQIMTNLDSDMQDVFAALQEIP